MDDIRIDDVQQTGACLTVQAAGDLADTLTIEHAAGGGITLAWGASCAAGDDDYEVYEGSIGTWYDHGPRLCTTAGATSVTFSPPPGDRYFLIVPRNAAREGSYGARSDGTQLPQGSSSCLAQKVALTCP